MSTVRILVTGATDTDPTWAGGDTVHIQQLARAVTPSMARPALGLLALVPGPVAGAPHDTAGDAGFLDELRDIVSTVAVPHHEPPALIRRRRIVVTVVLALPPVFGV